MGAARLGACRVCNPPGRRVAGSMFPCLRTPCNPSGPCDCSGGGVVLGLELHSDQADAVRWAPPMHGGKQHGSQGHRGASPSTTSALDETKQNETCHPALSL